MGDIADVENTQLIKSESYKSEKPIKTGIDLDELDQKILTATNRKWAENPGKAGDSMRRWSNLYRVTEMSMWDGLTASFSEEVNNLASQGNLQAVEALERREVRLKNERQRQAEAKIGILLSGGRATENDLKEAFTQAYGLKAINMQTDPRYQEYLNDPMGRGEKFWAENKFFEQFPIEASLYRKVGLAYKINEKGFVAPSPLEDDDIQNVQMWIRSRIENIRQGNENVPQGFEVEQYVNEVKNEIWQKFNTDHPQKAMYYAEFLSAVKSENSKSRKQLDEEDELQILEEEVKPRPPKILEALLDDHKRTNIIELKNGESIEERQALIQTAKFLEKVILQASGDNGDPNILARAINLRENLVVIGQTELNIATQGMAEWVAKMTKEGTDIYVVPVGRRSERYISLLTLDVIDKKYGNEPEVVEKVHFDETGKNAIDAALDNKKNIKILLLDDFVVSGSRMKAFYEKVADDLTQKGVEKSKVDDLIEANVVVNAKSNVAIVPNLNSFYSVEPGTPVTGTHATVDYGFENEINDMMDYLYKSTGIKVTQPMLYEVARPYEFDENIGASEYKNPWMKELAKRILSKYST